MAPVGFVYHVLNRSVGRMHMFRKAADFEAFEHVMVEAHQREPIRILAELWRWGSLWSRARGGDAAMKGLRSHWPVSRPANWTARVNVPLTAKELGRVRVSIERGRPYGDDEWVRQTVKALNLEHTVRREGRPCKANRSVTDSAG